MDQRDQNWCERWEIVLGGRWEKRDDETLIFKIVYPRAVARTSCLLQTVFRQDLFRAFCQGGNLFDARKKRRLLLGWHLIFSWVSLPILGNSTHQLVATVPNTVTTHSFSSPLSLLLYHAEFVVMFSPTIMATLLMIAFKAAPSSTLAN